MRNVVRVVAGLNAVFGVAVGLLSVVSPVTAAEAFKVEPSPAALLALIRMFGGLLASSGIISGVIAWDPDHGPRFVRAYAVCLLINVAADLIVIGAGQMQFGQLAAGMILELVLAVLLFARR